MDVFSADDPHGDTMSVQLPTSTLTRTPHKLYAENAAVPTEHIPHLALLPVQRDVGHIEIRMLPRSRPRVCDVYLARRDTSHATNTVPYLWWLNAHL